MDAWNRWLSPGIVSAGDTFHDRPSAQGASGFLNLSQSGARPDELDGAFAAVQRPAERTTCGEPPSSRRRHRASETRHRNQSRASVLGRAKEKNTLP